MKKLLILCSLVMTLVLSSCVSNQRTVVVSEPLPPPMWGPAGFNVRYYYLPDMMVYYDVHTGMFIYPRGNRWVRNAFLPGYYSHFDLYSTYVVTLNNYWGPTPYQHFNTHRNQFFVGYRGPAYQTIGNRGQDTRRYYTSQRGNSALGGRGSSAQGGRGSSIGSGRDAQTPGRGQTTTTPQGGRGQNATTPQGGRGQNTTATPQGGRGQSTTTPSAQPGRGQSATQPNSQGGRGTATTTPAPRAQAAPARVPDRIDNPNDARAVKQRTQEVRQQNRTQTQTQTPARSSSSGQSRGGDSGSTPSRRGGN